MQILEAELNIIMAALRRSELAYANLAPTAELAADYAKARKYRNNAKICKEVADLIEHRGRQQFLVSESQYRFIIRCLKGTAMACEAVAVECRKRGDIAQAEKEGAFVKGCETVAEKWERQGYRRTDITLKH